MKRRRYFDGSRTHYYTSGLNVQERKRGFYRLDGIVATAHGYVRVYALTSGRIPQRDDDARSPRAWGPVTRLHFIRKGREYLRDYPRILTRAGAIRCASRFAFEVCGR